jgi:hypothetical protein
MKKRGQFSLSFGMIFSIILIIAVIAVASFVLTKFISTSKCTQIGFFYNDLKDHTDEAWRARIHQDTFSSSLPAGIELVCFGNLTQTPISKYRNEFESIRKLQRTERNVFLYPTQKACDSNLASINLLHVKTNNFFCVPVIDSKISIKTSKTEFESLVTLTE